MNTELCSGPRILPDRRLGRSRRRAQVLVVWILSLGAMCFYDGLCQMLADAPQADSISVAESCREAFQKSAQLSRSFEAFCGFQVV